jgi:hypothetical protein
MNYLENVPRDIHEEIVDLLNDSVRFGILGSVSRLFARLVFDLPYRCLRLESVAAESNFILLMRELRNDSEEQDTREEIVRANIVEKVRSLSFVPSRFDFPFSLRFCLKVYPLWT